MRSSASVFVVIGNLAATVLMGSFASARTANSPGLAPIFMRAVDAREQIVYVADTQRSIIAVFDRDGTRVGTITKGLRYPRGLFVDGRHNLWVANEGPSNILEYRRGATSPNLTLPDGSYTPNDVAICPNGNVYAADIVNGITVYSGPRHRRSGLLSYGAPFLFVTCDAAGNVFATGVVGTLGNVVEFPGGQESGAHSLPIYSAGNLNGIKVDNAGNLLVVIGGTVTEYTEAGAPTGVVIETNANWFDIALDRAGNVLLGADASTNEGVAVTFPGGIDVRSYAGRFEFVYGVAFDPGEL